MIQELLHEGEANAISGKTLCSILNLNMRAVTKAIQQERKAGAPICASTDATAPGFYLAADKETMQNYCNRLRHRAGEIFATRAACLKAAETLPERGADNEQI